MQTPEAATPAALLHVDLDGLVEIYRTRRWPLKDGTDEVYQTGLANALDVFDRNNVRATLFLIADSLDDPAKRELVEEAVRRGHEIACHTLSHRVLTRLNRNDKRYEIEAGRGKIEDQLGVPVIGFRAPGYLLDREAADLLEECGYEYDASAFPTETFARRLNVPIAMLQSPSRPFSEGRLLELPLPDHRPWPVPFNPSYALLFGQRFFRAGLMRFRQRGMPLVLLFHLIDFAEPVPRELLHGWQSRVFTLSFWNGLRKLRKCQKMLDLVQQHYRITTTVELLEEYAGTLPAVGVA